MTSISNEAQEQPELSEDNQSPESDYVETSVDGDETSEQSDQPEEEKNGSVDDYVGDESPAGDNLAKRYADSSREAKKLFEEKRRLQQEKDELAEKLKQYESQEEKINNKTSDNSEDRIKKLEERIFRKEREEEENLIRQFELEHSITPEVRAAMKPIVSPLVKSGSKSLAEALKVAWKYISEETDIETKAKEEGKLEAYAETRVLNQAAYRESGKTSKDSPKSDLPQLTRAEYEMAKKMGVVDEQGRVKKSFLKSLKSVRNQ